LKLGASVKYVLNHWQALTRFTEDGRLELDNNRAERAPQQRLCGPAQLDVPRLGQRWRGGGDGAADDDHRDVQAKRHQPARLSHRCAAPYPGHPVNRLDELVPYRWTPISNIEAA
jgi:hypothetical protein